MRERSVENFSELHKNHLIHKNSRSSSRLLIRISNDYQNDYAFFKKLTPLDGKFQEIIQEIFPF